MEALSAALGMAPVCLALEYMAPSAWASIGAMATNLDAFNGKFTLFGMSLTAYKLEVNTWCKICINCLNHNHYYKCMEDFKTAFIGAMRALSRRLDNVELSLVATLSNHLPGVLPSVTL
jgi:hypothetical protein